MQAPRSLRPVLTAQPLPPQPAFRFRLLDSGTWLEGQVEDLSQESLSFLTGLPLEIGTEVEVALPAAALGYLKNAPLRIHRPLLHARVVARVLDRWPDLRTAVVADFVDLPGERFAGAA